jgi:hypothetical protein
MLPPAYCSPLLGVAVCSDNHLVTTTFRNEAEERRFWQTHDCSDYIDWTKATRVRFPNLKPSTTAISLRLPVTLLERIKVAANKRDVPRIIL